MKKPLFLIVILSVLLSFINNATLNAATTEVFSDISKEHWAYESIDWAVKNNIVSGYPDNTFRPNNQITEAEFVKLIVTSFPNISLATKDEYWYDPYYRLLQHTAWKIPQEIWKYMKDAMNPIKRGAAAQLMAATQGHYFEDEEAIQFLIDYQITKGKTDLSIEGYQKEDYLTRAEAIEFIYSFKVNRPFSEMQYLELDIIRSPLIPMYMMEKALVDYFATNDNFWFAFSKVYTGNTAIYVFKGKDGVEIDITKEIDKTWKGEFLNINIWKSETDNQIDYSEYYDVLFEIVNVLMKDGYTVPRVELKDRTEYPFKMSDTYYVNDQEETYYYTTEGEMAIDLEIQHMVYMMPEYKEVKLERNVFERMGYGNPNSVSIGPE